MREVMPYFRRSSGLSELGWTGFDQSTKNNGQSQSESKDSITLPLKLAHLCRNLNMPDAQVLELRIF